MSDIAKIEHKLAAQTQASLKSNMSYIQKEGKFEYKNHVLHRYTLSYYYFLLFSNTIKSRDIFSRLLVFSHKHLSLFRTRNRLSNVPNLKKSMWFHKDSLI
jgi:hypothetical protein